MRTCLLLLGSVVLLAACEEGQESAAGKASEPARRQSPVPAPAHAGEPAPPPTPAAPAEPPDDYPGVAEMSPSQRQAYERGYRHCRAGRYEPGEWAEAYRIGCAAVQNR